MKTIANTDIRTILLVIWGVKVAVVLSILSYLIGKEDMKAELLDNRRVQCEVVDYTSKDGFFTAVREGNVVSIKKK